MLNEMKGAYSEPSERGKGKINSMMFKDGSMRFDSGGDPDEIIKLTADDLRSFHKRNYTTDNAFVVFVSRYDLMEELKQLDKFAEHAFRGQETHVTKQL